jgi:hypothetical protein
VLSVHASCATQTRVSQEGRWEGLVASGHTGEPIAGARVVLCGDQRQERAAIENPFQPCDNELAITTTDEVGRFRLAWQPVPGRIESSMMVTSTGYLPWIGLTSTIGSTRGTAKASITLRRAPTVEVTVVDTDGKPISHAGAGWLLETKGSIQAHYETCCTSEEGKMSFGLDGVPEGSVMFFASAGAPPARFGTTTIRTKIGEHYVSVVRMDRALQKVIGRVVDASGAPLAALVSVAAASKATFSALDRVLLGAQREETDMDGSFERYLATPERAFLQLRTWSGLTSGAPHVGTELLSTTEVRFDEHPQAVVVRAPTMPIVRCSMVGPDRAPVALAALGIFFTPHGGYGHSGSCAWVGGALRADLDQRGRPLNEVSFIWPGAATSLRIAGHGRATANVPSMVGEIMLEHADDTCHILGK